MACRNAQLPAEFGNLMSAVRVSQACYDKYSGLGTAISYLLKHWERLTLFLRQPGGPAGQQCL
jgi:hypothetical protein